MQHSCFGCEKVTWWMETSSRFMNIKWGCGSFYSYAKNERIFLLTVLSRHLYWMDWGLPLPWWTAKKVIKFLIHEIIPRFGLLQSLQDDNVYTCKASVTRGVSKVIGIEYHLNCFWRLQSSGKVEKANDIIKRHLCKLTQETQDNWLKVLPIA